MTRLEIRQAIIQEFVRERESLKEQIEQEHEWAKENPQQWYNPTWVSYMADLTEQLNAVLMLITKLSNE